MRVREQHVGDVAGRQTVRCQPVDDQIALAEGADVDQGNAAVTAQQRDGAPAEPAMAYRFAGVALDHDLDLIAAERLERACGPAGLGGGWFGIVSHLGLPLVRVVEVIDRFSRPEARQAA